MGCYWSNQCRRDKVVGPSWHGYVGGNDNERDELGPKVILFHSVQSTHVPKQEGFVVGEPHNSIDTVTLHEIRQWH